MMMRKNKAFCLFFFMCMMVKMRFYCTERWLTSSIRDRFSSSSRQLWEILNNFFPVNRMKLWMLCSAKWKIMLLIFFLQQSHVLCQKCFLLILPLEHTKNNDEMNKLTTTGGFCFIKKAQLPSLKRNSCLSEKRLSRYLAYWNANAILSVKSQFNHLLGRQMCALCVISEKKCWILWIIDTSGRFY